MISGLAIGLLCGMVVVAEPGAGPRYVGALVDGKRIKGKRLVGWRSESGHPMLDAIDLGDLRNNLQWLRNRHAPPHAHDERQGVVHLVGGDRLLGRIVRFSEGDGPSSSGTPHLVIQPAMPWNHPQVPRPAGIRVVADDVRRIVAAGWRAIKLPPGCVLLQDGERILWKKLRWTPSGFTVLNEKGLHSFRFGQFKQLELLAVDQWEAYYGQLAVLSPNGSAKLVHVELNGGSVLTASTSRYAASGLGKADDITSWHHVMQPAWSLDPLWLGCETIRFWQTFAPHEVPLSRFDAITPPQPAGAPRLWAWRRDRNLLGGPLVSGGQEYGWGFGVHAYQQLRIELPDLATGFRSLVGLDMTAGSGGCARAEIFIDKPVGKPRYRSPHLIGSARVMETGLIQIGKRPGVRQALVLVASDAHQDRPPGTDPLNIRDMVDWLEPVLLLDREKLAEQVRRRASSRVGLPDGWQPAAGSDMQISNVWINRQAGFRMAIQARKGPLRFSRTWTPAAGENYLLVGVTHRDAGKTARMTVRINGERVSQLEIPAAPTDHLANPVAVPLLSHIGKPTVVELVDEGGKGSVPLHWWSLRTSSAAPGVARLFEDQGKTVSAALTGPKTEATLVDKAYSGSRSLRVPRLARFDAMSFAVRQDPDYGQFRYARFALRKQGGGSALVQWLGRKPRSGPHDYVAGKSDEDPGKAKHVWDLDLPDEWIVVTRDLHEDFGKFELSGLTIKNMGGEAVLVDHVYLARRVEDFDEIDVNRVLDPVQANALAKIAAAGNKALYNAMRATVQLEIDGHLGSGIVVSEDGHIASTAYVVGAPGRDVLVTSYDGRIAKGKTLGMNRGLNAGVIKIPDKERWHHVPLANVWPGASMFVLAHVPAGGGKRRLESVQVGMRGSIGGLAWTNAGITQIHSGGPLVMADGRLVGLHSQASPLGGGLHVPAAEIKKHWKKMVSGEVAGNWRDAQIPVLGVITHNVGGRFVVRSVVPASPAAEIDVRVGDRLVTLAGGAISNLGDVRKILSVRNPGDELSLVVERDGKRLTIMLRIARRP